MKNKLYFYSFAANYEDQIALGRTPMLKIGETTQDTAEERIKQQMGTATAQKPTIYGEFQVSFTDKQFHTFLRARGYSQTDGAGTEWFEITASDAEQLVYEYAALVEGVATPIRQELTSRPYQLAFVEKFLATTGDFCLFAKCRSGKSAMTLLAATEADYKSVVVVSYRTSASNSWLKDAVTFTVFHEWDVINLSEYDWVDKVKVSQVAGRRQLLVSTVQRQNEKFGYVKKLNAIYPEGVDLLALDECHIGGESDQFVTLKNNLDYRRLLEISGTAYKTIWKYPRENVFVWGYVEEQQAKRQGAEWAQKMPKMQLVFATYDAQSKDAVYGDDPDALKNVFTVVDGEWKDPGSMQAFLQKFFAYGTVHKRQKMLHESTHIVMSLPSVPACYLFEKTLREFGSPFVPLVITGDSGNNQAEILNHVQSNEATICLTVWANVVGVTVPQWDTVIQGTEYQSAEFWVQFAFRGGSTERKSWKVIDFVPERTIQSIVEMGSVTATVGDEENEGNVLKTFLEFADVFEFNNGTRELSYEGILEFGNVATASAKAITNAAVSSTRVGTDWEAMMWAFSDLNKIENKEQVQLVLNENGTNREGNVQLTRTPGEVDQEAKAKRETLLRIKGAVERIDDVVVHGLLFDQHLSTLPKLLSYDQFEILTACHPDLFQAAIDSGWVNERVVSNSVSQVHMILDAKLSTVLN
jgi:hypothetical protein